jgi:peptide chain release factor 2/peptide chain release factor
MTHLLVTAGVGPVEVRRFVASLAGAVVDACARAGLVVEHTVTIGLSDAPSSVRIAVRGDASALGGWLGTHALVDPVRGRGQRRRWYAGVVVVDEPDAAAIVVDPADVEVTATRSGGPGGQHVNTSSSAIRAVHRPTGIAVRVDAERSQHANRRRALDRLGEALAARAADAAARSRGAQRSVHHALVRGAPVRTWRRDADGSLVDAG